MAAATRSMQVWTAYVTLLGVGFVLIPNVIFAVFGIEETDEVWIRIVGVLLIGFGAYYWTAVRSEFVEMYRMSVWFRFGAVATLVVLAVTTGPWQLVLFAAFDLAGSLWTYLTLRSAQPAG